MSTRTRSFAISALIASLACSALTARAAAPAPAAPSPEARAAQEFAVRPGLTQAQIDEALRRAGRLKPKMTAREVQEVVGGLSAGNGRATLDDTLNALPRLPQITVTATNGICRFDFRSDDKGRFLLTSWAPLPGVTTNR